MAQDMNIMLDYVMTVAKQLAPKWRGIYLSAEYQILKDDSATRSKLIIKSIGLPTIRTLFIKCYDYELRNIDTCMNTPLSSPQHEHCDVELHHGDAATPVTAFPAYVFIGTARNKHHQILKVF
jgi:hypothetical protein